MEITKQLYADIYLVIDEFAQKIVNEVMREYTKYPSVQGMANADYTISLVKDEIILEVFGEGQKAWILEYGKGSGITTDNPYLSQYWISSFRNPLRDSTLIKGRPKGEYFDLDGRPYFSSGGMAGKIIESRKPDSPYAPFDALHLIRQLIVGPNGYLDAILEAIADAICNYQFEQLFPDKIYL